MIKFLEAFGELLEISTPNTDDWVNFPRVSAITLDLQGVSSVLSPKENSNLQASR